MATFRPLSPLEAAPLVGRATGYCHYGHAMTPENTGAQLFRGVYTLTFCRECRRRAVREWAERRRAKRRAA